VVLVGECLKVGIKEMVGRPRPSPELVTVQINAHEVHSFPSGHTVHYVVLFGFAGFLAYSLVRPAALRWPLVAVCAGLVLLVGLSRIYLGAHWVSDIVGGYLLGGTVLIAGITVYNRKTDPLLQAELNDGKGKS
jgi:undecaprenyl-diphosphatase